ncbi:unnamed protein product, partial [Staurois parvus]
PGSAITSSGFSISPPPFFSLLFAPITLCDHIQSLSHFSLSSSFLQSLLPHFSLLQGVSVWCSCSEGAVLSILYPSITKTDRTGVSNLFFFPWPHWKKRNCLGPRIKYTNKKDSWQHNERGHPCEQHTKRWAGQKACGAAKNRSIYVSY